MRAARERNVVDELEEARLLILRAEVAHADRLIAAHVHERDAAGLGTLRRNALEAEVGGGLLAGRCLAERRVSLREAESEEVDHGRRDGARPGGADVLVGVELRTLAAASAIGETGDRAIAKDVLPVIAPAYTEYVLLAEVVVRLEVALVRVLAAVGLHAVVLNGLPTRRDHAGLIRCGVQIDHLFAKHIRTVRGNGAIGECATERVVDVLVEDASVLGSGGHGVDELIGKALDEAFVVGEVEELVLADRPAGSGAELVPIEIGLRGA